MKLQIAQIHDVKQTNEHCISNSFQEKVEECNLENDNPYTQSCQDYLSKDVGLKQFYCLKQTSQQQHDLKKCIPKSYSQQMVHVRDIRFKKPPENIYMLKEYLHNFSSTSQSQKFLEKYQSVFKIIQKPRSAKKTSDLMNFLHLKSISLITDKLSNSINASDFIDKYKLRMLNNTHQQKQSLHISPTQFKNLHYQQLQPSVMQYTNVKFKLRQIELWTAEIINIQQTPSDALYLQISRQFLLFITSNYKFLKQASSDYKLTEEKKQLSSKQIKNLNKEDTQMFFNQFLLSTSSNYVEEFKKYKNITEFQKMNRKNSAESDNNQIFELEQEIDNGDCNSRKSSFIQKIQLTHQQYSLGSSEEKMLNEEKSDSKGIKEENTKNSGFSKRLSQNSQFDSVKESMEVGNYIIDNEYKDDESDYDEEEEEYEGKKFESKTKEDNNNNSSNNNKSNKKKRTNNFYNMPRYFMMLILELLSTQNLKDLGIQDGFIQIISRISQNLRQQGKKRISAKSNFYNHQHYNCLFQILLEDNFLELNTNNIIVQSQTSFENHSNKLSQQMEDLYRKVFEIEDPLSQFNQTYINSFKCIISQIIKYQLRIMQDLQLAQYILSNSKEFPFEKSKINYISRVIAGIEKLNAGQNIHRF